MTAKLPQEKIDKIYEAHALGYITSKIAEYAGVGWTTVNRYLSASGLEPCGKRSVHNNWTPEKIDNAFTTTKRTLGRVPTSNEFEQACRGAYRAILRGGYNKSAESYASYLKAKGLKPPSESRQRPPGYWNKQTIDNSFDDLRTEFGRTPTKTEFQNKYGGAYDVIKRGDYAKGVKTYTDYLRVRGLKNISSVKDFTYLLDTEPKARFAILLARGDEVDVADILAVVYEGRISKETAQELLKESSLRDYLGKFKTTGRISDITEPAKVLLRIDKGGVITDIIKRRLREHRKNALSPTPAKEQLDAYLKELDDEMGKLNNL